MSLSLNCRTRTPGNDVDLLLDDRLDPLGDEPVDDDRADVLRLGLTRERVADRRVRQRHHRRAPQDVADGVLVGRRVEIAQHDVRPETQPDPVLLRADPLLAEAARAEADDRMDVGELQGEVGHRDDVAVVRAPPAGTSRTVMRSPALSTSVSRSPRLATRPWMRQSPANPLNSMPIAPRTVRRGARSPSAVGTSVGDIGPSGFDTPMGRG